MFRTSADADALSMVTTAARVVLAALVAACLAASASVPAGARSAQPRLYAADSLEAGVLVEINAFRRRHRLAPLRLSAQLRAAADAHSLDMARRGYFSHNSRDGSPFDKRVARFYRAGKRRYWSVGENLLWSSPRVEPGQALEMWLQSPSHRANLLTARWREIGLSAVHVDSAPGEFRGLEVTILTADFGVRR